MRMRLGWNLFAGLALAGLAGCSRPSGPAVYPVHGVVRVDGRPAAFAQVTFYSVGDARPEAVRPSATTDEQGNFSLTTFAAGDGAPEGDYRVAVVQYLASRPRGPGEDSTTRNYLPDRYGRAETSQLRATVGKGENTLQSFDLKRN
jgi:hypothetical protein